MLVENCFMQSAGVNYTSNSYSNRTVETDVYLWVKVCVPGLIFLIISLISADH